MASPSCWDPAMDRTQPRRRCGTTILRGRARLIFALLDHSTKTIPCSCTTRTSTFNGGPRCTTFWVASLPTLPKEAWRSEPRRAVQANMREVMARGLWKCESPVLRHAQPGQVQALASLVLPATLFFVVVSEPLPSALACRAYRNKLQETGLPVLNENRSGCTLQRSSRVIQLCLPCLTFTHWRAPAFAFATDMDPSFKDKRKIGAPP